MDIKSSLIIEDSNQGKINLILSGAFVNVYNQSFYLLSQVLGRTLKPDARYFKTAKNRFVVCGGLPAHVVLKDYPQAVKTDWGFQISGNYKLTGYELWLLPHKQAARVVNQSATTVEPSCTRSVQGGSTVNSKKFIPKAEKKNLTLNALQVKYLSNWQKGLNPIESDLGFIESIRQLIKD